MQEVRSALVFYPTGIKPRVLSDTSNNNTNFLVGWNVRDFTIVVAGIVSAPSVQVVQTAITAMHNTVQKLCFTEVEMPSAPNLTIVGLFLRPGQSAMNDSDREIQELRGSTSAYIELDDNTSGNNKDKESLPTMRSLYTSGIKFDATLHLVTFDPLLFDKRRVPLPFSPLVRLETSDVEAILAGKTASRVLRGGKSVLEGPFLPPHALNMMPPLHPRALAPRSFTNNTSFGGQQPPPSSLLQQPPPSPSLRGSSVGSNATTTSSNGGGNNAGGAAVNDDDDVVEVKIKSLDRTVPPRLTFPTAASLTDLHCCKTCLSGVAYVQHRLEIGEKEGFSSNSKNHTTPPAETSHKPPTSKLLLLFEDACVSVAAAINPLVLLLLSFFTQLAKISYTAAILEYKLRELVNVLALIRGKTTTCGLHPALPHTLCGMRGERRTCLLAFAARQVVGDVLFGFGLSWLLMFSFYSQQQQQQQLQQQHVEVNGTTTAVIGNTTTTTTTTPTTITLFETMRAFAWYGLHGMHVGYFDWFRGYPAGFKMNADLNEVLCLLCLKTMSLFDATVSLLSAVLPFDIYSFAYTILIFSAMGGASLALSWAADCCNIATLHIRFLFHIVTYFYQGLTTTFSSLFLLMRGKKNNPLKNRVDDATFDFDEVVLGTMGCTACAFLVPTVALYYLYLACARTVIWILQESLRGVAVLCCNAPIYPGWLWLARRKQWVLTGGVVMTNVRARQHHQSLKASGGQQQQQNSGNIVAQNVDKNITANKTPATTTTTSDVVAEITFVPLPFMAIFRELGMLITLLFAGTFSPSRILRFIWTADSGSKPTVDVPNKIFRHLTADPAAPKLI